MPDMRDMRGFGSQHSCLIRACARINHSSGSYTLSTSGWADFALRGCGGRVVIGCGAPISSPVVRWITVNNRGDGGWQSDQDL